MYVRLKLLKYFKKEIGKIYYSFYREKGETAKNFSHLQTIVLRCHLTL